MIQGWLGKCEMRLNYNYQSGTFTIEAEDKEEAIQLKNAAMDIANMIVNYFDAEVQEAKVEKH